MSSFHAAFSLGGLVGAALGGALAGAGCGSGGQLWIPLGLAGLLNVLALPFIGRGSTPQTKRRRRRPASGRWLRRGGVGRTLLLLGLVASFCFVIEGAMADWSAIFLTSVSGSSVAMAATGYAAFAVAMAAGRFAGDWIVARFGASQVLVWGGGLAAGGLALAVTFPAPLVVAIGFAAVGVGLSNVVPVLFSVAARAGSTPAAGIAPVASLRLCRVPVGTTHHRVRRIAGRVEGRPRVPRSGGADRHGAGRSRCGPRPLTFASRFAGPASRSGRSSEARRSRM